MNAASVNLSDGPLRELAKQMDDAQSAYIKVGVLGNYASRSYYQTSVKRRTKGGAWSAKHGRYLTNPEIGAIHEFGSPDAGIPERSFLRMPIISRLSDELRKIPLKDWQETLFEKGVIAILRVIGQAAVNVINEAFHTGGFGRWAKLKPATIHAKQSSDILVATTQLRRSITFAIIARGATGGFKAIQAVKAKATK